MLGRRALLLNLCWNNSLWNSLTDYDLSHPWLPSPFPLFSSVSSLFSSVDVFLSALSFFKKKTLLHPLPLLLHPSTTSSSNLSSCSGKLSSDLVDLILSFFLPLLTSIYSSVVSCHNSFLPPIPWYSFHFTDISRVMWFSVFCTKMFNLDGSWLRYIVHL